MIESYDVGGVELERPFKARRLNHVVWYYRDFNATLRFYQGLLGLKLMDCIDSKNGPPAMCPFLPTPFFFMTMGPDMHNLAFVPETVKQTFDGRHDDTTINHYAWDVGSYEELRGSLRYFREKQVEIQEVALRMPGSNYAVYYYDPESNMQHTQSSGEIIGWQGTSKPLAAWKVMKWVRGPNGELDEAIPSDEDLTSQALLTLEGARKDTGDHSLDPYRDLLADIKKELEQNRFNVHGSFLPRPFKLTKLTYLAIQSEDPEALAAFYTRINGFKISAKTKDAIYLRYGADHHGLVIYSPESPDVINKKDKLVRTGIQLRTYQELKSALVYLRDNGVEILGKGRSFPGGEYFVDIMDPEKRQVRLFFYLEQVGWDGTTRSPDRWKPLESLPEKAEVSEDTYNFEHLSAYSF